MRPLGQIALVLDRQRGALFPWVPVCFAGGIGAYFALPAEPAWTLWGPLVAIAALVLALALRRYPHAPVLIALSVALAGFSLAALRTHQVAAPVLEFRYYGPIQGRIIAFDRSASDKVRLTLDQVVLKNTAPARTPERVRVSLHGQQGYIRPEPGLVVMMTGHLAAPQGPVEPGGFDFQRQAWFKRLGAVGYTRTPVLTYAPAERGNARLFLHRLRMRISAAVQTALPGRAGAFAAAITTGDRSGMDRETLDALRASNLAHLLAISGLHMGLLTAFVFAAIRYAMALIPWIALRWPVKKLAAVGALVAGAGYLALSGGNVATERAYVMVAVMLAAVLFDRRALTIRAVALAALIVLTMRPEALLGPGFQMSFAATTALIAVFGWIRNADGWSLPRYLRPVAALVVSSAVAGAATAPIAAAHFNQIPHYGLLANLMSVPLMGAVIIPGAVLAALLAPVGLGWIGLAIMRPAIEWILAVADTVSSFDRALSFVVTPGPAVLPLFALGALWIILWQGRARLAGLAPVALALAAWVQAERPPVLISETGGLVGVMTEAGRAISKERGEGFAARSWLENDGDPALQGAAFARPGFEGEKGARLFRLNGAPVIHLTGRGARDRVGEGCRVASLVILAARSETAPGGCRLLEQGELARTGAVAVYAYKGGIRLVGARDRAGRRPWNAAALARDR